MLATLLAFISLVWLREQILHGGGPDWLDFDNLAANHQQVAVEICCVEYFSINLRYCCFARWVKKNPVTFHVVASE